MKLISSSNLIEPRTIWDQRFSRAVVNRHNYEPWLEPWWSLFETSKDVPILDLDCGRGYDSLYLTARGLRVIAADFSREALKAACRTAVGITSQVQIDLRQGLPFRAATFQVIVANLSLYYFPRRQTAQIINGVRDCLRSGGYLLARFNSTGDVQYGASGHTEVEPNCFIVHGMFKHFFDREELDRLFETGWRFHGSKDMTVHCYGEPKVVWEAVVGRA